MNRKTRSLTFLIFALTLCWLAPKKGERRLIGRI